MATTLICDNCGEKINQAEPYYQVTAVKLSVENIDDPTEHNVERTVEIPVTFHYHDGHQPKAQPEPEPESDPKEK